MLKPPAVDLIRRIRALLVPGHPTLDERSKGGSPMSVKSELELPASGLRELTRSELEQMVNGVRADIVAEFADAAPIVISYLGHEIYARPMDTRRFIRRMSRHICLN